MANFTSSTEDGGKFATQNKHGSFIQYTHKIFLLIMIHILKYFSYSYSVGWLMLIGEIGEFCYFDNIATGIQTHKTQIWTKYQKPWWNYQSWGDPEIG